MMVFCNCQRAPTCSVLGNWPATTRLGDTLSSGPMPSAGLSDDQQACYLDYFVGIHLAYPTDCGLMKKDGSLSLWNSRLDPNVYAAPFTCFAHQTTGTALGAPGARA
jgi:hypothetical protein